MELAAAHELAEAGTMVSTELSDRSRGVALALAVPLGVLGAHRFYVGKVGTGILMFLTGGGAGIWWIVDVVNVATGGFHDRYGRRVLEWGMQGDETPRLTSPELVDELDAINADLDDVTDRLETAERRLAARERPREPN